MGAVAGGCLVGGFLAGMVVFGSPWHLPPAWGDVPTWLLTVLGVVAGATGLYQFRVFVRQSAEEARRNVKRDELLDRQLADAQARAMSERRFQAEGVELHWWGPDAGVVENNSARPVSVVFCKVMSPSDGQVLAVPEKAGLRERLSLSNGRVQYLTLDSKPGGQWDRLRPGAQCSFAFTGLQQEKAQVLVAWFTDDAGFRWQLDEYMHLAQAGDSDEYLP